MGALCDKRLLMTAPSSFRLRFNLAAFAVGLGCLTLFSGNAAADEAPPAPKTPEQPKPAPAAKAGVVVHVVEGARVLVDGADAGRADPGKPFELTLPPGDYTVRVVYDGGGNEKRKVLVTEAHVTDLDFRELPGNRVLFEKRDRWLLGFAAGGGIYAPDMKGELGPQFEGGAVLSRGLSRAVDFRLVIGVHGWLAATRGLDLQRDKVQTLGLAVSAEPGFLFHLGTVYTMGVSVAGRIGVGIPVASGNVSDTISADASASLLAGVVARASPAGFAFGDNREHHIELVGGVTGSTLRGFGIDMGEIRYSLLFF